MLRIEKSKTGDPRTLPYAVLPVLRELIEHRRSVADQVQQERGTICVHVFHRNGEPIRYFRRAWISACVAAGLGYERREPDVVNADGQVVRRGRLLEKVAYRIPHDYRRSAARNLSRAGVPERVIMQLCGWRTRSVFDRYRIVSESELGEGLAKLAGSPPAAQPRKVRRMRAPKQNTDKTRTVEPASVPAGQAKSLRDMVAWDGIEPPTRGFSVRCSTN